MKKIISLLIALALMLCSAALAEDYAIATGDNKRTQLQHTLMQAAAAHEHVEQVHGFYYFEDERRVSIDVVPDITIHDDAAFIEELRTELQPLIPDDHLSIVVDHNYSD